MKTYRKSEILEALDRALFMACGGFVSFQQPAVKKPGKAFEKLPEEIKDKLRQLKSEHLQNLRLG